MAQPFLGEIRIVAFTFAPRGYALCAGQLLPIAQNTALFSLLGTTYGGNGQTTFALPDLRGRRPVHNGQGLGLPDVVLGEVAGQEVVTLLTNELPAHTHSVRAVRGGSAADPSTDPTGAAWSNEVLGSPQNMPYTTGVATTNLAPSAIGSAGGSQPHPNLPPYLVLNYVIAVEGAFPSRN